MVLMRNARTGTEVTVSEAAAAKMRGYVPVASTAAEQPAPRTDDDGHRCDECGFVAKTAGGLAAHGRKHPAAQGA